MWCVLDKQDWDWAKHYSWRNVGRPASRLNAPRGEYKKLTQEIARRMFGKTEVQGMYIEHIDGNPYNCRRVNLRLATSPHEKKVYFRTLDEALEAQKKAQQEDQDAVIAEPAKKRPRPILYDPDEDDYFGDEYIYDAD